MKNKLPAILLSLVVALGLWLYVVSTVSPESEQTYTGIPVIFENESSLLDRNLIVISGQDATVSVELNGNRIDLDQLNASNLSATVDLSSITEPGHYEREYRVSYPSGVTSVSVVRRITATVSLDVAEYATKEVPVRLVYSGGLQENLILDEDKATMSAETVTVSGPRDEVDQISFAGLEIDCTGLNATLTGDFVYTLMNESSQPVDVPHVQTDVGEIHLVLPVEHIKEVELKVELVAGGGAAAGDARCSVEPKTIIISGSREALADIDSWTVATVNLGDVDLNEGYAKNLEIKLPDNLTNRSNSATVQVQVTLSGLTTKTVTLTKDQIQVENAPKGMDANVFTQTLDVIIRGPAAEVSALTAQSIRATVDLSDMEAGTYTKPLSFTIDGAGRAGVYGKYSVTVGLSPQDTEG